MFTNIPFLALFIAANVLAIPFALAPATNPPSTEPIPQKAARLLTNARRLQNGLPLKAPVRRTRTHHARQTAPSATPGQLGFIRILDRASGIFMGFAANTPGPSGTYSITNSSSEADWLQVVLPSSAGPSAIFAMMTTNGPDSNLPYFAATVGTSSASSDMGDPNTLNYYYMTSVSSDATANTYTQRTGDNKFSEIAVWTFNSSNNQLVPQWTNPNNQVVTPSLAFAQNTLVATGNEQIFSATFPGAQYITCQFVSAGSTTPFPNTFPAPTVTPL